MYFRIEHIAIQIGKRMPTRKRTRYIVKMIIAHIVRLQRVSNLI